ncbi:MAG: hypothetical protein ACM3S1_10475 [Hyphomicrobiales bacterium]
MGMVDGEIKQLVENERDAALMRAEIAESELAAAREQTVRVVAADEVADVVAETVRAELAKKVKRAPAQAE